MIYYIFYSFGCTKFSAPFVTVAEIITSSSFKSRKKSSPSTTYPKLYKERKVCKIDNIKKE